MNDTNFSFQLNLTGVTAAGGRIDVAEGYYNGKITQCFINTERNKDRVVFKIAFTDEGFHGVIRTTGLQLPGTTNKDNRTFWRSALESCGYTAAHLDQAIMLGAQNFVNRPCKIYYRPAVKDSPASNEQYDRLDFLSPQDWETRRGVFLAKGAAGRNVPTAAAVQSTPQEIGTPVALNVPQPAALGAIQGQQIMPPAGVQSLPVNGGGNIPTPTAGFGQAPSYTSDQIANLVKPS